ncbi:prepilin-type N-terminal cleavage/methylation domain-containing protein [Patescibacteria group bacterium]|nr:prepilin-type N-terminal cleavage/methylation domain-containing protein [Patescibacteria group bacterium]
MKSVKDLKSQSGFTIAELLVGIFIIALISGIFIANYRSSDRQAKLNMAAQQVVSDIRTAQNYSLGLQEFEGSVPKSGWGARFDIASPDSYIIFADEDEDEFDYDAGEEYKTVDLPSDIIISNINVAGAVDIVFMPPNPTTYINTNNNTSVEITLKENISNAVKKINVNFLGLIDIVD